MYNMRRMRHKLSWKPLVVAPALLGIIALFALAGFYDTFPGDEAALVAFQGVRTGWLDTSALMLAVLGRYPVAGVPLVGVTLLLFVLRQRADAAMVGLSLVPMLLVQVLKEAVERPRPDYLLLGPDPVGFSFPSGHTVYGFLVGGMLIYLTGKLVPWPVLRRGVQTALILWILAMGASRVYLGVHWPSDVIGGFLFGGVALLALIQLRYLLASRWRPRCRRVLLPW